MMFDDVKNLSVNGLRAAGTADGQPMIALTAVKGALFGGCAAPADITVFTRIEKGCEQITVVGNDLSGAAQPFEFADPSLAAVLFESANRTGRPPATPTATTTAPNR
jgi:hypothetical protein